MAATKRGHDAIISGTVVDWLERHGVPDARVEVWEKDASTIGAVSSATTDHAGRFVIRLEDSDYVASHGRAQRAPEAFFKVFCEGILIADTNQTLVCSLVQSCDELVIEVDRPFEHLPPATEIMIDGLPRPATDLPRLAILEAGACILLAEADRVQAYDLSRQGRKTTASARWQRTLGGSVQHLLALSSGDGLAIVSSPLGSNLVVLGNRDGAPRAFAEIDGRLTSVAVADDRLICAVDRAPRSAVLLELELASGIVLSEQRLASSKVDIATSRSGRNVSLLDRRARSVVLRRSDGRAPCPPVDGPSPPQSERALDPCDCGDAGHKPPQPHAHPHDAPSPDQSPRDHSAPTEHGADPCLPTDAAVPDDHGGAIVADGGRVAKRPRPGQRERDPLAADCWSDLFWKVDRLRWAGSYVLATQGNFMHRMALISANDLAVVREKDFGSQGALVWSTNDSDTVVIFHPKRGTFELLEPRSPVANPLEIGPSLLAKEEKVFVGQKTMSLMSQHVPTKGDINVLVLPMIEPGQAYNEPDLAKLGAFLDGGFFRTVREYYEENSFNDAHVNFFLFGRDRGTGPLPLPLPEPIDAYYHPAFSPGGVELSRALPAGTTTISFDGSESIGVRATTRTGGRGTIDLTLKFAALQLRAVYNAFPVSIAIPAGETATISAVERDGTARVLALALPPTTLLIEESNVEAGLAAIATYLDTAIATAETLAGVPAGRLFQRPSVKRVRDTTNEFGELHIALSFGNRPAGAGALAVTAVSSTAGLSGLGFGSRVLGRFDLPADIGRLAVYMERLARRAEADVTVTESNRVFAESVSVTATGGSLITMLPLSDNDGGPNASIAVTVSTGTNSLFTGSTPKQGGPTSKNDENTTKRLEELHNHAFGAAVLRTGGLSAFKDIHAVLVGIIGPSTGAPPSMAWSAGPGTARAGMREVHKYYVAEHDIGVAKIQFKASWIVGFLNGTPNIETFFHEFGHALGFRDLYKQTDYRDDLRYLENWACMDDQGASPHHCGYHKWQADWIPEARIVEVPKPDSGPTSAEALLVPVEWWDPGMEVAVKGAFPGVGATVAHLMRMNLGGDGGMFDLVEARQATTRFSTGLPRSPALIVTNALVPWDTKEYGQTVGDEQRYRRELHLLNVGHELQNAGDSFDLGWPDELAAKGIKVTILARTPVVRPAGTVEAFHVRVTREQAPSIDLGFTIQDPYWKNPDLWLDHPAPGQTSPTIWPEGEPTHQGEKIHVPPDGRPADQPEKHWVVARVHNYGVVDALNVRVDFAICRPPGAGDRGNFVRFASETVPKIAAGTSFPVVATWNVAAGEKGHTCLRATIVDSEAPEDAAGIALASDDVVAANSEAIKNLDQHEPLSASPYEPVKFEFSVNNEGHRPQTVYLQPEGLPEGMKLAVSPPQQVVPPRSTVLFNCRLELDDRVIAASCRADSEFTILAWRMTPETSVRWGGVQYRVRPRLKTMTTVSGGWAFGSAEASGKVEPDPGDGEVRLRVHFDTVQPRWTTLKLQPGGTFKLSLVPPGGAKVLWLEAVYRGSKYHGASQSPRVSVFPYVVK